MENMNSNFLITIIRLIERSIFNEKLEKKVGWVIGVNF